MRIPLLLLLLVVSLHAQTPYQMRVYTNIADMAAHASPVSVNQAAMTLGYNLPWDGGGSVYWVTNTGVGTNLTSRINSNMGGKSWEKMWDFVPTTRSITTTIPLTGGGDLKTNRVLGIVKSGSGNDGYLSATDWNTFNNKVGPTRVVGTTNSLVGGGPLSADLTLQLVGDVTIPGNSQYYGTGTNGAKGFFALPVVTGGVPDTRQINTLLPLKGGGDLTVNRTLEINLANASTDGYLSKTDWDTFNKKVPPTREVLGFDSIVGGGPLGPTDISFRLQNDEFAPTANKYYGTGPGGSVKGFFPLPETGGAAYSLIQKDGLSVTPRSVLNFIGDGVVVADNAAQTRTDVTIVGGGGGGAIGPLTGDVESLALTSIPNATSLKVLNTANDDNQWGSATQIPVLNVDAKGRVTSITHVTATGGGGSGTFNTTVPRIPYLSAANVFSDSPLQRDSASAVSMSGTLTATGVQVTGATASRIAVLDASKNVTSGTVTEAQLLTEAEAIASINSGAPNGAGTHVHWSQLTGVPAGFADGSDDGSGGGSGTIIGPLSGDVTTPNASSGVTTLKNTGPGANTFGSATQIPVITIDAQGRVTGVTPTTLSSGGIVGPLTGDITTVGPTGAATTLKNTGPGAGAYGSATLIPVITLDAQGRVTAVTPTTVAPPAAITRHIVLAISDPSVAITGLKTNWLTLPQALTITAVKGRLFKGSDATSAPVLKLFKGADTVNDIATLTFTVGSGSGASYTNVSDLTLVGTSIAADAALVGQITTSGTAAQGAQLVISYTIP